MSFRLFLSPFFISNNFFLAKTNENICLFSACFIFEKNLALFVCVYHVYISQTGNVSTKYSFFPAKMNFSQVAVLMTICILGLMVTGSKLILFFYEFQNPMLYFLPLLQKRKVVLEQFVVSDRRSPLATCSVSGDFARSVHCK